MSGAESIEAGSGVRPWTERLHARLAGLGRRMTEFTAPPEPRRLGDAETGRRLVEGRFLFGGHLVEAADTSIWDLPIPAPAFEEGLHGFAWLDDLAAAGDPAALRLARAWTQDWIARFGRGTGRGWTPELTARRQIRWIHHGEMLRGRDAPEAAARLMRALARQTAYLARRSERIADGASRIEAAVALILAARTLKGLERHAVAASRRLGQESARLIDARGGIASRNPEALMEVFAHLVWAQEALHDMGRTPHPEHLAAMERVVPVLRALTHADGGLARFHGGGRGGAGRLDQALAASGIKGRAARGGAMGFVRLAQGRTTLIVDAAPPPSGQAAAQAHASTLAFEMTAGRQPVVVNCGTGAPFGMKWHRAGRATASHSVLAIDGYSSSRLGVAATLGGRSVELLADAPGEVRQERRQDSRTIGLIAAHDGYVATHGLSHIRQLHLALDGTALKGEDVLACLEAADEERFERACEREGVGGIAFRVRFHLHPDIDARMGADGASVSLRLPGGTRWTFTHAGRAELLLEASVYLEPGRPQPLASRQIVLVANAVEYATRVAWYLAKDGENPDAGDESPPDDPERAP